MKVGSIIQSIFGLTAILSFISIFLFIFINKDYIGLFAGMFFIFLPLSVYMNRFTRGYRFSVGYYILFIILLAVGLVTLYFGMNTLKTKTIYEFSLENSGDAYTGGFNIPNDVPLDNKDYSFFIDIKYSSNSRGISSTSYYEVEFISPTDSHNSSFSISSNSRKGITYTESRIDVNYKFAPSPGDYTIKIAPTDKNLQIIVSSIKIQIRVQK